MMNWPTCLTLLLAGAEASAVSRTQLANAGLYAATKAPIIFFCEVSKTNTLWRSCSVLTKFKVMNWSLGSKRKDSTSVYGTSNRMNLSSGLTGKTILAKLLIRNFFVSIYYMWFSFNNKLYNEKSWIYTVLISL